MPKPQIYTSYVNQMCSSLLIGIMGTEMALTVEDIFGNVVHNVTVIDFVRESFVSQPSVGQSDIHGDTGWWRLSNTSSGGTGNAYESMFGLTTDAMPTTATLRTIQTTDIHGNLFQGFTTNMSDLASGAATLDDNTQPSWYFGNTNVTGVEILNFIISVLDPGITATGFLNASAGLFNLSRNPAENNVYIDMYPDLVEAGFVEIGTSGTAGNVANLQVLNADGSQFQWRNNGARASFFKINDGVSGARFQWTPAAPPTSIFDVTENTGQSVFQIFEEAADQTFLRVFGASSGAVIEASASSTAADAFIRGNLGGAGYFVLATPGAFLTTDTAATFTTMTQQDGAIGFSLYQPGTGTARMFVSNDGKEIQFLQMPTSAAGLPAGCLWNNGGVVNIT